MDTLLITVTALSLVMAAAMALVVMKLVGDERRRSDARVAALAEMSSDGRNEIGRNEIRSFRLQPEVRRLKPDIRPKPDFRLKPEATRSADLDLRPGAPGVAGVADLFAEPERSSPWGRRLAVIAALATVVATTGFVLFRSEAASGQPGQPTTTTAPSSVAPPLELLSLRHTQEPERLTITGLVQNPRGAAPLTRVVATAFAFGPDGTVLASGRAPLDFTSLGGGDESPFVVTVPVTGTVARYRVGFRAEDGTVLAHVDKRAETVAQR